MAKVLAYPLTALYLICFGLTLVVFHPVQWVCLQFFGYSAHQRSVACLNLSLLRCTHLLGTRYSLRYPDGMPESGPLIIVTNHQSMYDIPPIVWYFRKYHPKFVSKKELGKGIPSVSYNLRHGGSALIDRNDRRQAHSELERLGRYIEETGHSAVIFPEGTRSRTGVPKPFKSYGLKVLMKNAPSAHILPISINNSWKMFRYGKFPHGLGAHIRFKIHPPMPVASLGDDGISRVESIITSEIDPVA